MIGMVHELPLWVTLGIWGVIGMAAYTYFARRRR
jgi:hypothetical protein